MISKNWYYVVLPGGATHATTTRHVWQRNFVIVILPYAGGGVKAQVFVV